MVRKMSVQGNRKTTYGKWEEIGRQPYLLIFILLIIGYLNGNVNSFRLSSLPDM